MALHKNFDPSKQFRVTKMFHEGGRKYVEGDDYSPRTRIGRSKVLFRHFIAGRVEMLNDQPETQTVSEDVKQEPASEESTASFITNEEKTESTKPAPRRGRKKKSTSDED